MDRPGCLQGRGASLENLGWTPIDLPELETSRTTTGRDRRSSRMGRDRVRHLAARKVPRATEVRDYSTGVRGQHCDLTARANGTIGDVGDERLQEIPSVRKTHRPISHRLT